MIQDNSDFDPYAFHYGPRVHFVEWVDRDLRSYSYGARLEDPRTGEILKGHVRIGSLRLREDILLATAFLSPFSSFDSTSSDDLLKQGCDCCYSGLKKAMSEDVLQAVLQRVKLLGAHEVGHALGLAHNFAGSTFSAGFASVMDYPSPLLQWDEVGQRIVLNNRSYVNDIGFFDKVAIDYGYRHFDGEETLSEGEITKKLYDLIADAERKGYAFLTDEDAGLSGSDWRATRWDSGLNPIEGLNNTLKMRSYALKHLTEKSLSPFSPISQIRQIFPIVYLHHRYEVEACAKLLGGLSYQYSMKSDSFTREAQPVEIQQQRLALQQLIDALNPDQLSIPVSLQTLLATPPAFGYELSDIGGDDDLLFSRSKGSFDIIAAYETAADVVVSAVFDHARLERLSQQGIFDSSTLSLEEVLKAFTEAFFSTQTEIVAEAELMAVRTVIVNKLLSIVDWSSSCGCGTRPSAYLLGQVDAYLDNIVMPLSTACNGRKESFNSLCNFLVKAIRERKAFLSLRTPNEAPI